MKTTTKFKQYFLDYIPQMILFLSLISFLVAIFFFSHWREAVRLNSAYADQSILTHKVNNNNFLEDYSIGYLLAKNNKPNRALKAFETAEATPDPHLRALAKYALANLYANTAEGEIEHTTAGRNLVARILLARESYKAALRLEPELYDARFNLERLDRVSPEKRGEGSTIDEGYTIGLDPFKQNGRALMKDNTRRGLP